MEESKIVQIGLIIPHMFPELTLNDFEIIAYEGGLWEITKWNSSKPKPTYEEMKEYWGINQNSIMEANKPKLSDSNKIENILSVLVDKGILSKDDYKFITGETI